MRVRLSLRLQQWPVWVVAERGQPPGISVAGSLVRVASGGPHPPSLFAAAGTSVLSLKDGGRYLGEPVCSSLPSLQPERLPPPPCLGHSGLKLKLLWARPPPPSATGLILIKQHEEAESPGLHSFKIVALPVVLSQTGLSGLGSWGVCVWGGGAVRGGSLGTAGHLMGRERPLAPRAGPGARSPIARLLAGPTAIWIPGKGSSASPKG